MFLDFYKLREDPFPATPDPRFLYLSRSHDEALAAIFYGFENDRGVAALIAKPGLGKTILAFHLLNSLPQEYRMVYLPQSPRNPQHLLQAVLTETGGSTAGLDWVGIRGKLRQILLREHACGRRFILAIDEAQDLSPDVQKTLRMLLNFGTSQYQLLQILLIGRPQLAQKLASPSLAQLQQRVSLFARIEPFGFEDTVKYIERRLAIAGHAGAPLFTPAALLAISERSQGIPRGINRVCADALSLACSLGRAQVDADILNAVNSGLDIKSHPNPPVRSVPAFHASLFNPILSISDGEPPKRLDRWVLGVAAAAAALVVVSGSLLFSPQRVERAAGATNAAWMSVLPGRNRDTLRPKTEAESLSALDTQAQSDPDQTTSPANSDPQVDSIVVQPGDTLRQIILRSSGLYNSETVGMVQKLNPSISNFDDLKAGQQIRIQRGVVPLANTPAANRPGQN